MNITTKTSAMHLQNCNPQMCVGANKSCLKCKPKGCKYCVDQKCENFHNRPCKLVPMEEWRRMEVGK